MHSCEWNHSCNTAAVRWVLAAVMTTTGCGLVGYGPPPIVSDDGTPAPLGALAVGSISSTSASPRGARVAATDTGLAVVWTDDRGSSYDGYLQLFDDDGTSASDELRLGASGSYSLPGVAWSGTEIGVLWREGGVTSNPLWMSRFGAGGNPQGTAQEITTSATNGASPDLAWNGTAFGGAWPAFNVLPLDPDERSAWFAPIDSAGVRSGPGDIVSWNGDCLCRPDIAWGPGEWAVVTANDGDVDQVGYNVGLVRLASDGSALNTPPVRLNPIGQAAQNPRIAWNGTAYAVTYDAANELWVNLYSADGTPIASPVPLASAAGSADVVWVDSHFLVVWATDGPDGYIMAQWLGEDGALVGQASLVADSGGSANPVVAARGARFWIVWDDESGSRPTLMLATPPG